MFYRIEGGVIVGGPFAVDQQFPVVEMSDGHPDVVAFNAARAAAKAARESADQADIDRMEKKFKALAMLLRKYTNETRAGVTANVTVPAMKADFKQIFDALP